MTKRELDYLLDLEQSLYNTRRNLEENGVQMQMCNCCCDADPFDVFGKQLSNQLDQQRIALMLLTVQTIRFKLTEISKEEEANE